MTFCAIYSISPVPINEQTLLYYISLYCFYLIAFCDITSFDLKATTIHVYMAAIRNLHILQGAQPPPAQAHKVKLALKAIYESGPAPDRKYPMTFTLLQSMLLSLSPNHDHIVWHAIMTLHWFGGLNSAEYTTVISASYDRYRCSTYDEVGTQVVQRS